MLIQSKRVMNKVRDMTPCPTQPIPTPRTGRNPLLRSVQHPWPGFFPFFMERASRDD